jgi:protein-disulfide isomerase
MTKTRWIIFILICLSALSLIIFVSKNDNTKFTGDASRVITDGPISDHTFGSKSNKIVLIEYADYQCPGCGTAFPMIKDAVTQYKDQVTFVFRNMPLTNAHPNALAASTAAEAAGKQGKYYEYHDLLYSSQSAWSEMSISQRSAIFEAFAKQLGLNVDQFRSDLSGSDITAKINRDRSTANKFGVTSTPTLILNGTTVDQATTFDKDKLKQLLSDAVTKAGMKPPTDSQSTSVAQ